MIVGVYSDGLGGMAGRVLDREAVDPSFFPVKGQRHERVRRGGSTRPWSWIPRCTFWHWSLTMYGWSSRGIQVSFASAGSPHRDRRCLPQERRYVRTLMRGGRYPSVSDRHMAIDHERPPGPGS